MTRQIVMHLDDLGASHGANMAFIELCDMGLMNSGAVMVPCPWFPEMAELARQRPQLDIGVHLTLTAEWTKFRWRPLTGVSDNGLTDPDGFFWRRVADARKANLRAVEAELRLQIDTALRAGIDITHLDSHMGTVWHPEMLALFTQLGEDYRLPVIITRDMVRMGADAAQLPAALARLEAMQAPIFDAYVTTTFGKAKAIGKSYRRIFEAMPDGLSWGAWHCTTPGDMNLFAPDMGLRATEYDLFREGKIRKMLEREKIETVGMRQFRDRMRAT